MFSTKLILAAIGLATLAAAADDLKNCYCGYPTKVGKTADPPAIEAVCSKYGTVKKDSGGYTACGILIDIDEPLFFNDCTARNPANTANWCE